MLKRSSGAISPPVNVSVAIRLTIYDFFTRLRCTGFDWILLMRESVVTCVNTFTILDRRMSGSDITCLVRVVLSGRFRVESPEGLDLTPKGAKNQALLALMATSPDLFRNRRWLEDKLWSDRGSDQASASLRQALSEIRRALGQHAGILLSDRQKIGLQRELVQLDLSATGEPEFLEGIDVRDVEFEAWLRNERHRQLSLLPMSGELKGAVTPVVSVAKPPLPSIRRPEQRKYVIVLQKSRIAADGLSLMEDLFIDCVALALRESLGISVFTRRQKPDLPNTIAVTVQAFVGAGGERFLRARAVELDSERVLWSGNSAAQKGVRGPDDPEIVQFANQTVEVLGDALTLQVQGGAMDALMLQRLAVRKLWTMNPDRMAEAETLLNLSDEMSPRGLNVARRAQLRALQLIERHGQDGQSLREEADACCRWALEREPNNSMVLAVVAYARCAVDDKPHYGAELASRSVRMNPNNPLAWDSLSFARLYAGHLAEAHAIALKVQKIGSAAPNKFWWDMGLCLTAALAGDEPLALQMAQSAAVSAPDFRAALRHVIVLAAASGQRNAAAQAASQLQKLEPSFSLDVLANDTAYPVGLLRRAGMLDGGRIMEAAG
jgi:hypothetical protein